jgi:hypothetical protein
VNEPLERARRRRASLRAAMGDVESAVAAPAPGREGLWRQDLERQLAVLSEALEWHVEVTEGDDGLLAEIGSSTPRLGHRIERARRDHVELRAHLRRLSAALEAEADVGTLRDEVVTLLTELVRHRQLGADLVYDAYNVDIEAAD